MLKRLGKVCAILLASSSAAFADCKDLPGKITFDEDFSDDSGGWALGEDTKIENKQLILSLREPRKIFEIYNNTFDAGVADYCMQAVMPQKVAPDNEVYIGLRFLNYVLFVTTNGHVMLGRFAEGEWRRIGSYSDAIKLPPAGEPITLRARVAQNAITTFFNDKQVGRVRVPMPAQPLKFGMWMEIDKAVPSPGVRAVFKQFRVTTAN